MEAACLGRAPFKLGLDGLPGAASSTWLTALRPSCFWSTLGCWQVKCISQQYAMAGFWSEVGLGAKAEEVAGQRSVNGNAQVAGRQFYPRSRPWLMGGQIKAARSRSTDDHGLSVLDYST